MSTLEPFEEMKRTPAKLFIWNQEIGLLSLLENLSSTYEILTNITIRRGSADTDP